MEFIEIKDKAEYLENNYPFEGVSGLDEKRFCIHCDSWFTVGDYKVELLNGEEYIVCPNAPKCNGTLIDWSKSDHKGNDIEGNFIGDRDYVN